MHIDFHLRGRNRPINPVLYFFAVYLCHHAEKNPVKPKKVSSPIVTITKRVTPRAISSSAGMIPSLIRVIKTGPRIGPGSCQVFDNLRIVLMLRSVFGLNGYLPGQKRRFSADSCKRPHPTLRANSCFCPYLDGYPTAAGETFTCQAVCGGMTILRRTRPGHVP